MPKNFQFSIHFNYLLSKKSLVVKKIKKYTIIKTYTIETFTTEMT